MQDIQRGYVDNLIRNVVESKLLAQALNVSVVFFILANLLVIWPFFWNRTDQRRDVVIFWKAAQNAGTGHLYQKVPDHYGPNWMAGGLFFYAPPFAAILKPFNNTDFLTFARGWLIASLVAFWGFAYCLAQLSGRGSFRRMLILGVALSLFPGAQYALSQGQTDPFLWMFAGLGMIFMEKPSLWMIAALVKPFYLWPALIDHHKRKPALVAASIILIAIILGGVVCGWNSYLMWFQKALPVISQGSFARDNYSLSFAVLRLLLWTNLWNYTGGPLPVLPHAWLTLASVAAPMLTWFSLRRQTSQIKAAAVLVAAALFAPVCWGTYLPLILLLLVLLWKRLLDCQKVSSNGMNAVVK